MTSPDSKTDPSSPVVTRITEIPPSALPGLLRAYGMTVRTVAADAAIPGSYWGETEAGLIGDVLYVRADTPVHSALHEACHYICMDEARRTALHTDAGGADIEEVGVCYLQVLLADLLPGYSRARILADMDAWGYHYRLGSAQAWFEQDAEDARAWLQAQGLIDADERPLRRCRRA